MEVGERHTVILSLGSNLGDRKLNLDKAIELLNVQAGEVKEVSPVFETPPLEMEAELYFYNLCLEMETKLNPEDLLDVTQKIERDLGRKAKTTVSYASRTIDIDIIYYNSIVYNSARLTIPHPKYKERRFVLEPMSCLSKALKIKDPATNELLPDLLNKCPDTSVLKLLDE